MNISQSDSCSCSRNHQGTRGAKWGVGLESGRQASENSRARCFDVRSVLVLMGTVDLQSWLAPGREKMRSG